MGNALGLAKGTTKDIVKGNSKKQAGTLPAMILRIGSTIDLSSTVPVATAGSKGVYRK